MFIGNGNSHPYENWEARVEDRVAELKSIGVKIWPITPMHCDQVDLDLCPNENIQRMLRGEGQKPMWISGWDEAMALSDEFRQQIIDGMECDTSEPCNRCNCTCPFQPSQAAIVYKPCHCCDRLRGPKGEQGRDGAITKQCPSCSQRKGRPGAPGVAGVNFSIGPEGKPGLPGSCDVRTCIADVDMTQLHDIIEEEIKKTDCKKKRQCGENISTNQPVMVDLTPTVIESIGYEDEDDAYIFPEENNEEYLDSYFSDGKFNSDYIIPESEIDEYYTYSDDQHTDEYDENEQEVYDSEETYEYLSS